MAAMLYGSSDAYQSLFREAVYLCIQLDQLEAGNDQLDVTNS
ncbi:MAG: hypothetical protein QUV06_04480 [Cyanobium sp. CZS 48M]|nr:hypothetical protein [Cyanobium sp. CZS48M]